MREYELVIDEALKKGLTPEVSIPKNENWLMECLGFRIGKNHLEGYQTCDDDPLSGIVDIDYSWPFPQFIQGEKYNFLISRESVVNHVDSVYLISDDYIATHIFDIDELTFGVGTLMEVADFGLYAFMTNGVIMIYWDVGLADWHEIVASATIPMMRTICNFKGQAVGGGVVSDWHDCDETYYCWSKIGEMDFTPDIQNEAGYRRCPFGGEVYHVRRLGDSVIGYSSKGITLMSPVAAPVATFGFTELDDIGLVNRGAIDGNLQRQVYVNSDYRLMEVTKDGVKELGYYSYIEQLKDDTIIVKYDKRMRDFYIGNSTKTYLLSPYGLTEVPQHPSAIWSIPSYDNETVMLPNTVDTYSPSITTPIIDFGYRGQKTISSVESDALLTFEPKAIVGWANTLHEWGYSNEVPLNNEGIAAITISGNEFIIKLNFDYVAVISFITYIKVRFKMTDLRGIRGVYAPPTSLRGQR